MSVPAATVKDALTKLANAIRTLFSYVEAFGPVGIVISAAEELAEDGIVPENMGLC